jgi:hypothetical protein
MEEVERTVALRGRVICREEPVEAVKVRLLGSADILGSDPRAALYKPGAVTWTKAITGFDGTAWNCWQRFVARHVAGITWDEFKGQIVEYNPTLRETGGRLEARRTYYLPENKPSLQPGIIWDRSMHGFYGHRWACWKTFVRTKVIGMTWEVFKEEVVARNPHLADDRLHFVASKSYLLPRNVGQDLYMRVGLTNAKGEYEIRKLPSGSYGLEIATMGYRPLRRPLQLPTDMTLDLQIERIEFG